MNKKENAVVLCNRRAYARPITLACALGIVCLSQNARAVDGTWTQVAGGNYGDAANWRSGVVADGSTDGVDSTAFFNAVDVPATGITVNLDSNRTLANLTFGDTDPSSAGAWTIAGSATNGTLSLVNSAATPTFTVTAPTSAAISAPISSSGYTLTGGGILTVSGANNVQGPIMVTGQSTLVTYTQAALGTGAVTLNNGSLQIGSTTISPTTGLPVSTGTNISNIITIASGAGPSTIINTANTNYNITSSPTGSGTLNFLMTGGVNSLVTLSAGFSSSFGSVTAPVMISLGASTGTLRLNSNNNSPNTGSVNVIFDLGTNTGKLTARNAATINLGGLMGGTGTFLQGQQTSSGTLTYSIGGANTNTAFNGTVQNLSATAIAAITKVGTGTLTLAGSNTYTGATTVNAGTLALTGANTATGNVTVNAAVLLASRDGALGGTSNITVNAGGQLTLSGGTTNNYINDFANVTLATGTTNGIINLNFTGPPDSVSSLTVNGVLLNPGTYTASSLGTAGYLFGTGSITVAPVPEPSAWVMVVGGLGVLTLVRRSRRQKQTA